MTRRVVEIPCLNNPLGTKGVGEANAVVDALRPFGVTNVDMRITAERVWRALKEARA